jgi:hypothetical protein
MKNSKKEEVGQIVRFLIYFDCSDRLQVRLPYDNEEEYIDLGAAELSFYAILVELLGRCAPAEETIKMGKPNAIRAKSILKSLVSMHDLEGVLGLKFLLPRKENMFFFLIIIKIAFWFY